MLAAWGWVPGLAVGTGPGTVLPSPPSAPLTFKDGTALALSCMADYGGPVFPFLAVGGYKGKPGGPGEPSKGVRWGKGSGQEGGNSDGFLLPGGGQAWEGHGATDLARLPASPSLPRSSGLCLGSHVLPLAERGKWGGGLDKDLNMEGWGGEQG